jgi:hypothetical protein
MTTTPMLTRLPALRFEPDRIIIGSFIQYNDTRGGFLRHDTKALMPTKGRPQLGLCSRRGNQRFIDRVPEVVAEVPGGPPLPDVDELNASIPRDQWPIGLSGQPEPPWKREYILYMLDLTDLAILTFSNSTNGAMRCVVGLEERWEWAKALFGPDVLPLFELSEAPHPTSWGERKRPICEIKGWRRFHDGALRVVDTDIASALETPPKKSASEMLRDSNPY